MRQGLVGAHLARCGQHAALPAHAARVERRGQILVLARIGCRTDLARPPRGHERRLRVMKVQIAVAVDVRRREAAAAARGVEHAAGVVSLQQRRRLGSCSR